MSAFGVPHEVGRGERQDLLAHAAQQARERGFDAFPIVDVDAHHYELKSFRDFAPFITHPTIRRRAEMMARLGGGRHSLLPAKLGDQDVAGRIARYSDLGQDVGRDGVPSDVVRFRQAMDRMGVDYAVMFPTQLLSVSLHPQVEVEVHIISAYVRWMTECILPCDPAIKTLLPLPLSDPDASLRLVEEFGDRPGVIGFMVSCMRRQAVHDNRCMKVYAALEERGLPLAFHSAQNWEERVFESFNRFLSVHALGFPLYNMIHLTNMVVNGVPERFPRLRFIWMEGGVAWVPFLMHRLDNEYMMRSSEAPQLKRKPSEYMREFYYTTQPLERTDDMAQLQAIFAAVHAETQLLFASDYPHWDFDLPSRIYDLPFLTEAQRRRILGGNALELFGLPVPERYRTAAKG